jgi:2,3-dihydroxybenzoate-AMP ligase
MTHKDIIAGWNPYPEEDIKRYVSKGLWYNLTSCDLLDRNADSLPDKIAFCDDKCEITWKEVKQGADRMAIWLHRAGIGYGDFFVLQMLNTVEFFYVLFGLNRVGAVPVMCIPRHRRREVDYEIGLHKAKGIIVPVGEKFDFVEMASQIRNDHPYLKTFLTAGGEAPPGWNAIEDLVKQEVEGDCPENAIGKSKPVLDDICVIQLSGGTTGLPKGIPRTYMDYICQWDHVGRALGFTDETVALDIMPVGHNASAITVWGPMIFRGGTTVLTKSMRPKDHFELIEKKGITFIPMVPVQINYWMNSKALMNQYDLSSLKLVSLGAQKAKPEQVRWCLEELGVSLVNFFGMAEGPVIATRPESPKEAQMYTIGRPIIFDPDIQIRIVDDDNQEIKSGEIGEMISKGPLAFRGYFRNETENEDAFDEQGFFHSGDLMSLREDGRFVVEGRKKDMVIRGGENVYPEPVEDILVKHLKVAYAAVVGMPDPALGERLCAFVQPLEGQVFSFQEMKEYLNKEGVAIFQWPERLEVVNGWPLTGMNKINKRLLRAFIATKLIEEGVVDKTLGDEYLQKEDLTVDEVLSGEVTIHFAGTPS